MVFEKLGEVYIVPSAAFADQYNGFTGSDPRDVVIVATKLKIEPLIPISEMSTWPASS
ncbi:hypothetical protein nbrc107697_00680 [Gordonia crocea]|uniref:Uncharacterized protein n=1 Tax=Gordonia crocea TaxID=589162 RepID=A0A7M4BQ68_9ACTN|nr:hypothetical protein nbrc107697_00680 [Gordonia crocea]